VRYDVPLSVDADDEVPLVLADLSEEALDGAAGGRGPDHSAIHQDDFSAVVYRPRRRHCMCWCLTCGLLHDLLFFSLGKNRLRAHDLGGVGAPPWI
jgi:hypothetical protein